MKIPFFPSLLAAGLLAMISQASAALELSSIIADNMVLQRDTDAPVWGWDTPGTSVTVAFRNAEQTATAGPDGKWLVRVPTGEAGGPFVLKIKGTDEREIGNVLVGEVWIAAGQSNMWWHLGNCKNADAEAKDADDPAIRVWDANTSPKQSGWPAATPQRTVQAQWKVSSPAVAKDFPGTPFFFARELHRKLNVPVGIVHIAVPGQQIEPSLSEAYMKANFPEIMEMWERRRRLYAEDAKSYEAIEADWHARVDEAKNHSLPPPPQPPAPPDPEHSTLPGQFFNGMTLPAAPYAARGFLWWQGESNADRWAQYSVLFPGLIEEYRQLWGMNAAPFIFCELHSWLNPQKEPVEENSWPNVRDAQRAALALPSVYEVCNLDILAPEEGLFQIHPANKQQAAHRMFLAAMANVYGEPEIIWSGPRMKSARFEGDVAVVSFEYTGGGLVAKDGGELKGFALAGADRVWHWADRAEIDGPEITLTSKEVPRPVAARYAWANKPNANLFNKDGLPAFPFRTDHWNLGLKSP